MKSFLPLLSVALLVSCTTAYKTGQTPDDVYFSPERPQEEYVRVEKDEERRYRNQDRYSDNDYYSYDDRYLRMKVRNRQRWNYLDNEWYSYNPYNYRYYNNYYFNSPWNSYAYWNYYYNPYAPQIIVINPKSPVYNRPRTMNLHIFDNPQTSSNNPKAPNYKTQGYEDGNYNRNRTQRRNFGDDLRDVFGTSGSNGGYSNNTPSSSNNGSSSRSSGNSGSSSSSGSSGNSGGGGSAPVRRF